MDGSESQQPDASRDAVEIPYQSATEAYEQALASAKPTVFVLVLYVAGTAPRSLRAIKLACKLCEEYLPGAHDLEIVDIYQQPALAEAAGVVAVPALVKKFPPPVATFIGDLTDAKRLLSSLGLAARPASGGRG